MPHALLLSPDDQAVSAITGVLEEMSVTCERPLDGASAAQKLTSQSFDLVLVDCENLPAAKLIFDVCRRGRNGHNPVPIAIVDGRAGLPTAFRLGAELILTKPVAKDQARTTIRAAVGRVRKDVPATEDVPAEPLSTSASAPVTEERAQAAAAHASSQLTSFSDPAPSFVPAASPSVVASTAANTAASSAPTPASVATLSTLTVTAKMKSAAVAETEEEGEIHAVPTAPKLSSRSLSLSFPSPISSSIAGATTALDSKPPVPIKPSDDPVLAELERTELEELAEAAQLENPKPIKTVADQHVTESFAPVPSSSKKGHQKPSRSLLALLTLMLAGGGFYAAWMYQPGFREIAQPQIDRVLALVGMPPQHQTSPSVSRIAKSSVPVAPTVATSASAAATSTGPNQTQPGVADSTAGPTTIPATDAVTSSGVAAASNQTAATPGPDTPPASVATTAGAPAISKNPANKSNENKTGDAKKSDDAEASSSAPLPGESSAIILSSKGAEKRILRSTPPKYPAEARAAGTEGTVVLKEVVDENGKVEGVRLVEGDAILATAAINAVKQWRYRPYLRDGKAQPFQTVVIVDFQRP